MPKPGPYETQVGATSQKVWFAYYTHTEMLRDKKGVGRRFKSEDAAQIALLEMHLARANKIIGWMMPYIGNMCPPDGGLADLNEHCFYNRVPEPGDETKGAPLRQAR